MDDPRVEAAARAIHAYQSAARWDEFPPQWQGHKRGEARAALAAADAVQATERTDRERLDAMADYGWRLEAGAGDAWHVLDMRSAFVAEGNSARAAIDAAMDQEEKDNGA